MSVELDKKPVLSDNDQDDEKPCHFLDDVGRPICGTNDPSPRPEHTEEECVAARHPRCATCDSLAELFLDE